ncbi:glycoside hydrolase family 115 protein [Diplodia corticola]|uniref:Glycoside hydrolase family 115 protein n=1 Tax=Diplodia corticola TaxID=236234 RepID=A0A1J9RFK1_9PEZI|nr:glycoside hydrolase family 115 protein [Diplodia corticola]OJD40310.1 glycoside hydrolase family 115 protein [Diplodia corticola]
MWFLMRLVSSFLLFRSALAIGQNATIAFNVSAGSYQLASRSSSVGLMLDAADWPGVLRVADDLALDFGRITGLNGSLSLANSDASTANASVIFNVTGRSSWTTATSTTNNSSGVIIAGTLGNSTLIQDLVDSGKLDVSGIEGRWESFTSQLVESPVSGVSRALVIAGSDKRGTIYGLYDISEQIGVSPWYFMADSSPASHDAIYAIDTIKIQGPPSVKYRGFFINDEAPALTGWMNERYPKSEYGSAFGAEFYAMVFELLLRLRANYLWPAMWASMFNVDDPRNQPLADEYGIIMGTSHTEPMMRATNEWTTFGKGSWQWNTNNESIYPFFVEGVERAKPYESVVTIGMRGSADTAMSDNVETEMLEDIVDTQRQILTDVYGSDSAVPQMWCLYKEVQGYYEAGMRVPDDVILLWADDNWGNNRRLPAGNETDRPGGAGVYYHFDYVGDPRNHKWINAVQLEHTWEQMHMAYEKGAREMWIVNVGDIKPLEIPISHLFDLAYDISLYDVNSTSKWTQQFAAREFGASVSQRTADVLQKYGTLVAKRKYELMDPSTYSLINYEEADNMLAEWQSLASNAQSIYDSLPAAAQPSFFQMVLHPVLAGGNVYDIHISAAKNRLYAAQGRTSANAWAQRVLDKFNYDHELTQRYNGLLGGKWDHMMDQTHLGYVYWQQPMRQVTPPLQYVQTLERSLRGDMGVSVEGSNASVPGDDQYHTLSSNSLTLPPIDPYSPQRWIDIYASGTNEFSWNVSAASWIEFSQTSGTLSPTGNNTDVRIYVSVDWANAPAGSNTTTINITSSTDYGTQFSMPSILLPYNHTAVPPSFTAGFVESDGHISIEAAHYTRIGSSANSSSSSSSTDPYQVIPSYGRTLSGVHLRDALSPPLSPSLAPPLEYDIYTFTTLPPSSNNTTTGANLTLYLSPSLNTDPSRPLRYAVAIDDDSSSLQEVAYVTDQPEGQLPVGWEAAVADAAWVSTTGGWAAPLREAGRHTVKVWALEPGVVVQKVVLDLGGVRESYLGPPESYRVG